MKEAMLKMLVVVLVSCVSAQAQVLDDFETSSGFPTAFAGMIGVNGWEGSQAFTDASNPFAGDQAMSVGQVADPAIQASFRKTYGPIWTQGTSLEMAIRAPRFIQGNNAEFFFDADIAGSFVNVFTTLFLRHTNGTSERLFIQTNGFGGNFQPIDPVSEIPFKYNGNIWQTFGFTFDWAGGKVFMEIDGLPVTDFYNTGLGGNTGNNYFPVQSFGNISKLTFNNRPGSKIDSETGEQFTAPVLIDNITFIPEPVTLSLLALGGLGVLRRRRA
jgi:hypothetical protein